MVGGETCLQTASICEQNSAPRQHTHITTPTLKTPHTPRTHARITKAANTTRIHTHIRIHPDDFTLWHAKKKNIYIYIFFFAGVDDGGFFLVVGVLIWTIPAILLLRSPPRWWGYFMQKTAYDFVCFWLRFFLSSDDKNSRWCYFAVSRMWWDEYGSYVRMNAMLL